MEIPETRYAQSGNVSIAYQVVGDGPFDLVYAPAFVSHVELAWEIPSLAAYCVFAQDAIKAWVWIRGPGGFPPGPELFDGESAVIRIEALALDLPLKEIYVRVRMD